MKRKTTVYLDDDLLRAMRVAAARAGKPDDRIVEDALRTYSEDDALALAYEELHQAEVRAHAPCLRSDSKAHSS